MNNFCFNFFNSQLVGLLSKIEKAIVETAGIGWGHCAPSSCTKADFYNNYKVKIKLLNQVELIFMEYVQSQLPEIFFGMPNFIIGTVWRFKSCRSGRHSTNNGHKKTRMEIYYLFDDVSIYYYPYKLPFSERRCLFSNLLTQTYNIFTAQYWEYWRHSWSLEHQQMFTRR